MKKLIEKLSIIYSANAEVNINLTTGFVNCRRDHLSAEKSYLRVTSINSETTLVKDYYIPYRSIVRIDIIDRDL